MRGSKLALRLRRSALDHERRVIDGAEVSPDHGGPLGVEVDDDRLSARLLTRGTRAVQPPSPGGGGLTEGGKPGYKGGLWGDSEEDPIACDE